MRRSLCFCFLGCLVLSTGCAPIEDETGEQGSHVTDDKDNYCEIPKSLGDTATIARLEDDSLSVHLAVDTSVTEEEHSFVADNVRTKCALVVLQPSPNPAGAFFADLDSGEKSTEDENGTHVARGTLGRLFGRSIVEKSGNGAGLAGRVSKIEVSKQSIDMIVEPMAISDIVGTIERTRGATSERASLFGDSGGLSYDFSGKALYSDESGLTVKVKTGTIRGEAFAASNFSTRDRHIDSLGFWVEGKLDVRLVLEASAEISSKQTFSRTLFEHYSPLPPMFAGGIPILSSVRTTIVAKCSASASGKATVRTGFHAQQALNFNAGYDETRDDERWNADANFGEPMFEPIGPELQMTAKAAVDCSVTPKFTLLFYGLIGPYVSASPRAIFKIEASNDGPLDWTLDAELSAKLGLDKNVKLVAFPKLESILDKGVQSVDKTLFTKTWPLASGRL